jgi:hypothetical protein
MKTHTVIAQTTKGHRVFLEGTASIGWTMGARYHVTYEEDTILLQLAPEGKRKVTASKGGVIDLESKKVTRWAQGATQCTIVHGNGRIAITRTGA